MYVYILDWLFLLLLLFVSVRAYCVSLDTGCVKRFGMPLKIFTPPSQLSRLGIRCPALFVCVCVCWSVCVGLFVLGVWGAGFLSPLSVGYVCLSELLLGLLHALVCFDLSELLLGVFSRSGLCVPE